MGNSIALAAVSSFTAVLSPISGIVTSFENKLRLHIDQHTLQISIYEHQVDMPVFQEIVKCTLVPCTLPLVPPQLTGRNGPWRITVRACFIAPPVREVKGPGSLPRVEKHNSTSLAPPPPPKQPTFSRLPEAARSGMLKT